MKRKLLLISNSTNAGEEYLAWCKEHIRGYFHRHGVRNVLFIPYAGVNLSPEGVEKSYDLYEERVAGVFKTLCLNLHSIHREKDPVEAITHAEGIAVGGGNTFHLVKMMHDTGIMRAIRNRVLAGIPYAGWSAGANVACPTMKTTNDMPIAEPHSFKCLNLVPFQINPHYLDANPEGHAGETRQQRILEFLAVNREMFVAGLREGTFLELEGKVIKLSGKRPLRLFRFGQEPLEIQPGGDLSLLMH